MSEAEACLLRAAAAGDRHAAGQLFIRYEALLRRRLGTWIPRDLQSLITVEDILQDTYRAALVGIGRFRLPEMGSIAAWLVCIAQRQFVNACRHFRAAKRGLRRQLRNDRDGHSVCVETLLTRVHQTSWTASRSAIRREQIHLLYAAMNLLREEYRDAVKLRYIEGKSVNEVAAALGRSPSAVQMLCHRGMHELREQLEELGGASVFGWSGAMRRSRT